MQLQFGSLTVGSTSTTLCMWMYSEEKTQMGIVKFVVFSNSGQPTFHLLRERLSLTDVRWGK